MYDASGGARLLPQPLRKLPVSHGVGENWVVNHASVWKMRPDVWFQEQCPATGYQNSVKRCATIPQLRRLRYDLISHRLKRRVYHARQVYRLAVILDLTGDNGIHDLMIA